MLSGDRSTPAAGRRRVHADCGIASVGWAPSRYARAMDHPKKSAGRRMMEAQDRRLAQVEEARQLATHLRDKVGVGAEAEAGAEEPGSLATAVAWVAAELRAGRIEHHDREALQQETGNRLRRRASDAHTV